MPRYDAIDGAGRPLPHTEDEVKEIVHRSLAEGTMIAAIIEMPDGALAIHIIGDEEGPTQAMLDNLEQATEAYRALLKGH